MLSGDQFDSISEWVVSVTALHLWNIVRFGYCDAGLLECLKYRGIILAAQRRVRFPGWAKIRFDAQMNLYCTALEPASAALCQFWRLWDFHHAQQIPIKGASTVFFTRWHGELNMVNCNKG